MMNNPDPYLLALSLNDLRPPMLRRMAADPLYVHDRFDQDTDTTYEESALMSPGIAYFTEDDPSQVLTLILNRITERLTR